MPRAPWPSGPLMVGRRSAHRARASRPSRRSFVGFPSRARAHCWAGRSPRARVGKDLERGRLSWWPLRGITLAGHATARHRLCNWLTNGTARLLMVGSMEGAQSMRCVILLGGILALGGCANSTGVLPAGPDTYTVTEAFAPVRGGGVEAQRVSTRPTRTASNRGVCSSRRR